MSLNKVAKVAQSMIDSLENGKSFPSNYVATRLESCASQHPGDQLLGNMRDVIKKVASKQSLISQKEIADVYNRLYGFSNGDSAFRAYLSDLLPENYGSAKKTASVHHSTRVGQDLSAVSLSDKSELSNSFERIFSLGKEKSFGTYDKSLDKSAVKLVNVQLKSLGLEPNTVSVSTGNNHFILCTAQFKNYDFTTSTLNIPVQISSGKASMPDSFISNENVVALTKESALVEIKNQAMTKKASGRLDFSDQRPVDMVAMPKITLPENMKSNIDYETILSEASSGYNKLTIQKAAGIVSKEISMAGLPTPYVKFASATKSGIIFSVKIATTDGAREVMVPVDIIGSTVTLPSEFRSPELNKSFDFSTDGFATFAKESKISMNKTASFVRETDDLKKLSYQELIDRVATGVASGDYRISEDAISVISDKYPDRMALAMESFQTLIKHASKRVDDSIIKEAVRKGILIKRANSVELYCPKLGMPLSKIDFDKHGNPVPKYRTKSIQLETLGEINPMTSKILVSWGYYE